jgi:predicted phage tail protein
MKLQDLTCNRCGAPLKVPQEANFVTCNHCSTQLAVRRTEHVAFTEQLDKLAEKTDRLSERIDDLSQHTEVAALDRQWAMEQSNFLVSDKHGSQHLPSEGGAIGGGIMITVFGCLWTAMALGITSSAPSSGPFVVAKFVFPLFGVCFVLSGIVLSLSQYSKARDYRQASRRYRRRRAEILGNSDSSLDHLQ